MPNTLKLPSFHTSSLHPRRLLAQKRRKRGELITIQSNNTPKAVNDRKPRTFLVLRRLLKLIRAAQQFRLMLYNCHASIIQKLPA